MPALMSREYPLAVKQGRPSALLRLRSLRAVRRRRHGPWRRAWSRVRGSGSRCSASGKPA